MGIMKVIIQMLIQRAKSPHPSLTLMGADWHRIAAHAMRETASFGGRDKMGPNYRDRLLQVFKERAFSFGNFTLASGKQSTYYINSKKAIFHSEASWLLAEVLWEMTQDLQLDAGGGP